MPADYDVTSSEQVTVMVSPTQAMPMTRFGIRTKPYGATAFVNIPVKNVSAQAAATSLEQYALLMNLAMQLPGVVSGVAEQDIDAAGLLADYVVFTVSIENADPTVFGAYEREVRVLTRNLSAPTAFDTYVNDPIVAARAFLERVVNG